MLTLARLFFRKVGSGAESCVGWPCASAEAPRGFRVCSRQAEQSLSTALLGRLQKRSIQGGKSCQQEDVWGFADFELIDSPRGNFSASLTSFPKKPLKRWKMRETDRRKQSF